MPLICECTDARCTRVITLSLDEYVAVRDGRRGFMLVPGHERAGERVVERNERFSVVELAEERA